MGYFLQLLQVFFSPWTICVLVSLLVFRREIVCILRSFGSFADSVTEVKYKDMEISAAARKELAIQLVKQASEAMGGERAKEHEDLANELSSAVERTLSSAELSFLAQAFSKASALLVPAGSRHEGTLFRLRDGGALELGSRILGLGRSGVLQEWRLTPAGRVLQRELDGIRRRAVVVEPRTRSDS